MEYKGYGSPYNNEYMKYQKTLSSTYAPERNIIFQEINQIKTGYIYYPGNLTYIQIIARVGSQIEKKDEFGISHTLEHMLFKGSQKYPSGINILHSYSSLGASMNAYTDYDHTAYYLVVMNDYFDEGFDLIADLYLNPLLKEEDLKKEINPILSEYREKEDDPEEFLYDKALEQYLNYYHSILGTPESIKKLNKNKLVQFKNKYYVSNNTIVIGVGGIYPEDFYKKVDEYFSYLPSSDDISYPKCDYKPGEMVLHRKDIQESYYFLFYPLHDFEPDERYSVDFLNFVLGGMDSSLLYEKIREELGLSCYSIYSNVQRNQSFSILEIAAGVDKGQLPLIDYEIRKIIDKLCNQYLDNKRIEIAKRMLKTYLFQISESSKGLGGLLLEHLLQNHFDNPLTHIMEKIENINKENLLKTAQRIFSKPNYKAILVNG